MGYYLAGLFRGRCHLARNDAKHAFQIHCVPRESTVNFHGNGSPNGHSPGIFHVECASPNARKDNRFEIDWRTWLECLGAQRDVQPLTLAGTGHFACVRRGTFHVEYSTRAEYSPGMAVRRAVPVEIRRGFPGNAVNLKSMFRVIPGKMAAPADKVQRDNSLNNE